LDAAQKRGEVARNAGTTHHRPKKGVRTADTLSATLSDLGIARQRAAEMKALARCFPPYGLNAPVERDAEMPPIV